MFRGQKRQRLTDGRTHRRDLVWRPQFGVVLDDGPLSQQGNLDRMNPRLIPEHALDRLRNPGER